MNADPIVHYVFWTGGFDSTYCVCAHLFHARGKKSLVQPIYLAFSTVDSFVSTVGRQNRQYELKSMERIREALKKRFPAIAKRLLPTWIVRDDSKPDATLTALFIKLSRHGYRGRNMGRPINQYERLSRYAKSFANERNIRRGIEIGILGDGSFVGHMLFGNVKDERLKDKSCQRCPELAIFEHMRFPILGTTKHQLLRLAKVGGFFGLLQLSWSCWYPVGDRACGHCQMCRQRVLPQRSPMDNNVVTATFEPRKHRRIVSMLHPNALFVKRNNRNNRLTHRKLSIGITAAERHRRRRVLAARRKRAKNNKK